MKRLFLISCIACIGIFNSLNASSKPASTINLKGGLVSGGPMRTPPVEAYQNTTNIGVKFNIDLGSLTIEVIDESGDTVFQTVVNAKAGGTLSINTNGWEAGEFILVIMDTQGGYLEGNFLIN